MKFLNLRLSLLAFGTVAAMVSTSASADWTFNTSNTAVAGTGVNAGVTVNLSGFSAANTSGIVSGTWTSRQLMSYSSGFGVNSDGTATPNHAVDNQGATEAILLNFGSSTVLSSIGLGYTSNGQCKDNTTGAITVLGTNAACPTGTTLQTGMSVDVSVFRWTGAAAPAPNLTTTSATTMTGWELVGNYGNMVPDTSNPYNTVNTAGKTSSWWLISAYNSGFTGASYTTGSSTLDNGNDYFKLYAVAGTACATNLVGGVCGGTSGSGKLPEPATLALTSVALLGVAGLRRRSKAKLAA